MSKPAEPATMVETIGAIEMEGGEASEEELEQAEEALEQAEEEAKEAKAEGEISKAEYEEILRQIRLLREDIKRWRRELNEKPKSEPEMQPIPVTESMTFETPPPPPPANRKKKRKKVLRFGSKR